MVFKVDSSVFRVDKIGTTPGVGCRDIGKSSVMGRGDDAENKIGT